ncbi:MAG: prepilin-type N-terminal cleavage/methylation domain-containing protein [Sulfurimonas sp.]|jgi:prepilin-type N-terminal cleavage/methylation domain-containing protein|nr:prepilin-type N-terminal cleavage/methylation domain-containing protein [Sulfurimonas sp.]MBU1217434.1 prepilin-type N-terminal cleavage/methylation domain-containing protein [bacterium]MBU1433700.1 prepilin-type N-terminal cleavage/methylation domain-containing protein [bacterium]MBU1503775.1 prepilin-type N-terminal cleavage/methylation domain-containing protein [bacterium]MBU3939179.1 prepilin-type N-terminal cleavage/methylation domain-containing protein [bacterium]
MKKAFTMLELVFVIVVIGILAAVIIPNTRTNPVAEAAVRLISNIRYTQHLAMLNDKYGTSATWYRNRWQIVFSGAGNNFFSIVSDDGATFATDPQNSAVNLQNIELDGVTVTLTGGCNGATVISFDNLGRPLIGSLAAATTPYPVGQLLTADCVITLTNGPDTTVLTLRPETGYISGI